MNLESESDSEAEEATPQQDNSRAAYDALPYLNWSKLRLLEKTPAHYRYGYGEDSSAFKLGTAAHMAVLEPEKFAETYVIYTKIRRSKAWDQFLFDATAAGKQVLNAKEHAEALAIKQAIYSHPAAARYLASGQPEVALTWELGSKGSDVFFECKGRADFIGDAIVDIKTTRDASPRGFAQSVMKYGYAGQAAWYSDGVYRSTRERKPFVIIAVESTKPYVVTVFRVPESVIDIGREQYMRLLGHLRFCQKNNFWGGYSVEEEVDLELPQWATQQAEESDE